MSKGTPSGSDDGKGGDSRRDRIEAALEMTRAAKQDAAKLGLKFEAYLLDMVVIALSERLDD